MIIDQETNLLYLSDLLPKKYPIFYINFKSTLEKHSINTRFIKGTRDIWCRDYMPIQINNDEYVQFRFFPDYYLDYKHIKLLTIQEELEYKFFGKILYSNLIVDGGNIVKACDKAVITDKVFKENKTREKQTVINRLKKELKINELIIIPKQPGDLTGHSDSMVRFYDNNTLLINDFSESPSWMRKLYRAIGLSGLKKIKFPYQSSERRTEVGEYTAHGCYINYLHIGKTILFPQFGKEFSGTDKIALKRIRDLYPTPVFQVEPLCVDDIAYNGGVLNCCTWNILKH